MKGHALMFGALWIGTTSICICELFAGKVEAFDYAERSKAVTNSAVDPRRQIFQVAWQPGRTSVRQPDPGSVSRTTERQMRAIRVWVIDSVRVEEKTLAAALDKAQVIFGDAGVRVLWTRCPVQANQAELNVCQPDDTNKLFLRIVRQPAIGFGSRHALGQAFSGEAGSQYATVFHDRVLAMVASRKPGSEALVLGHVIAHELGHLLLGTSAHSSFGLMAAGWSAADLERAPAGLLEFSSAEAATIRAAVIRRNIAACSSGGSEAATSRAH